MLLRMLISPFLLLPVCLSTYADNDTGAFSMVELTLTIPVDDGHDACSLYEYNLKSKENNFEYKGDKEPGRCFVEVPQKLFNDHYIFCAIGEFQNLHDVDQGTQNELCGVRPQYNKDGAARGVVFYGRADKNRRSSRECSYMCLKKEILK